MGEGCKFDAVREAFCKRCYHLNAKEDEQKKISKR
jgi:hypothetical protein